jgi:hypothetical protein
MIRTTCAWVLLILAASPVTAPFASCDLQAFFTPSPFAWAASGPTVSISPATSIDSDEYSVSPIVSKIELPKDSLSSVAVLSGGTLTPIVGHGADSLDGVGRSPDERPARPRVLRV